MRVAGLAKLSLFIMQRNNSCTARFRQPTLAGLWQREDDNSDDPITSRAKKRIRNSVAVSTSLGSSSNSLRWEDISLPNGPMHLLRGCIGGQNSHERRLTREVLTSLPNWNENIKFKIFGKECQMRRRICQYSTGGKIKYSYSGLHFDAPKFPQVLYDVKCKVENLIRDYILDLTKDGTPSPMNLPISSEFIHLLQSMENGTEAGGEIFNYCLCNHYRTGEDSMGYHADDEATLDHTAPIASVSFGITRSFDIRPRQKTSDGKKSRVARVALGDGDLLLMLSPMQQHYEHAIPMEKRLSGERINLTFRRIKT